MDGLNPPAAWIEIARIPRVLAALPGDHGRWLSGSEQARLAALRHPGRRSQFLAGHWLVRGLLVRAFGGAPEQWTLQQRTGQPPSVQGHDDALRLSISHTEHWVAAAVCTVPIGIDLEARPRRLDAAIEPLLLNVDEPPGCLDPDALLMRWVAKEAWIKREADTALPDRLRRLQLHAAPREQADVLVDSHAEFHFALAIASGGRVPAGQVEWHGEPLLPAVAGFRLSETDR